MTKEPTDDIGCSRRAVLKTVGVAAGASPLAIATGRASATGGRHTLSIEGHGSRAEYTFTVDSNLEPKSGLSSEDSITNNRARGAVKPGKDIYTFDGDLITFNIDGPMNVLLDGEAAHVGHRPDHVLTIDGTGGYASYAFTVSGSFMDGTGLTSEDSLDVSTATGAVRSGNDGYRFTGKVESFTLDGNADLRLDSVPKSADEFGGSDSGPTPPLFGACFPTTTNGDDESQYYENWLGREVMVSDIFIEKRDQMLNMPSWKIDPWTNWLDENQHRRLCWDVLVRSYSNLRAAANGGLTDEFQSFGRTLVREGHENAYIRIEDEFDLDHAFHPETSKEKQWFVEFWREAVDTLRAVDGQEFTIVWNPNYDVNEKGGYAEDTWPGGGYVDQVGIDIYDLSWPHYDGNSKPTHSDHVQAWRQSKGYLDWFQQWCDDHDKPLCIPEWGLWSRNDNVHGGGDNPYFIKRMYDWIHQNDVAWHVYFEELHKHEMYGPDTQFPKASATFKQLFG